LFFKVFFFRPLVDGHSGWSLHNEFGQFESARRLGMGVESRFLFLVSAGFDHLGSLLRNDGIVTSAKLDTAFYARLVKRSRDSKSQSFFVTVRNEVTGNSGIGRSLSGSNFRCS
jgi:hypothetical protein